MSASNLLSGETDGFAFDFTADAAGLAAAKESSSLTTDDEGIDASGLLVNNGASPKLVRNGDGELQWTPHNLFVNPTSPATQAPTLVPGAIYTVHVTGTGTLTGSDGASAAGAVTEASGPVTFTASGTTGTFTLSGSLDTIQLNRGSSLTTFLDGGASPIFGVPIEYDPDAAAYYGAPEPQETNDYTYSVDLSDSYWTHARMTATGGESAPDGSTDAYELADNSGSSNAARCIFKILGSPAGTHTLSVYAKDNDQHYFALRIYNNAIHKWALAIFDVSAANTAASEVLEGTSGAVTVARTSQVALANGWYRLSATFVLADGGGTYAYPCQFAAAATGNSPNDYGDLLINPTGGKSVYLWNAQYEEIEAAETSPILAFGSSVTRAADILTADLADFPSMASAGTIYVRGKTPKDGNDCVILSLDDATANEKIVFSYEGGDLVLSIIDGGSEQLTPITVGTVAADTEFQVSFAWAANDVAVSLDGAAVDTDSSVSLPTFDTLHLGCDYSEANQSLVEIQKIVGVPRRVPDGELPTWRYNFGEGGSTAALSVNDGGTWKTPLSVQARDGGTWKPATGYVKSGGVWVPLS